MRSVAVLPPRLQPGPLRSPRPAGRSARDSCGVDRAIRAKIFASELLQSPETNARTPPHLFEDTVDDDAAHSCVLPCPDLLPAAGSVTLSQLGHVASRTMLSALPTSRTHPESLHDVYTKTQRVHSLFKDHC